MRSQSHERRREFGCGINKQSKHQEWLQRQKKRNNYNNPPPPFFSLLGPGPGDPLRPLPLPLLRHHLQASVQPIQGEVRPLLPPAKVRAIQAARHRRAEGEQQVLAVHLGGEQGQQEQVLPGGGQQQQPEQVREERKITKLKRALLIFFNRSVHAGSAVASVSVDRRQREKKKSVKKSNEMYQQYFPSRRDK